MRAMPDNSVDVILTDPPYGLGNTTAAQVTETIIAWTTGDREFLPSGRGFMGKEWDAFVPPVAVWDEAMRVLKPGGHMAVFSGARTVDLMGLAIRLAGFEIRDVISWIYGTGFPKSLNVEKSVLAAIEGRYGNAEYCLDDGDGCSAGHVVGSGRGKAPGAGRSTCEVSPAEARNRVVSDDPAAGDGGVRQLRGTDGAEEQGPQALEGVVLFEDLRGRRSETAGLGDAPLRARLEEDEGTHKGPRHNMLILRPAPSKRDETSRSPQDPLQIRGNESPEQPGVAMRQLSPHDRGSDNGNAPVDPNRSDSRRVIPDDQGGRRRAIANVCSWCGRPDGDWLRSLKPLGTALKPAHEPIILARKPLAAGTVAANVLEYGTGALNIDASRIGTETLINPPGGIKSGANNFIGGGKLDRDRPASVVTGRFPANVILDESQAEALDAQSGWSKSPAVGSVAVKKALIGQVAKGDEAARVSPNGHGDSGGASRFFYVAKAGKKERPVVDGVAHPTVKPLSLIQYLARLITPPGGVVLEPFAGSGTTVEACILEGFDVIAIERDPSYIPLIQARIDRATPTEELEAAA